MCFFEWLLRFWQTKLLPTNLSTSRLWLGQKNESLLFLKSLWLADGHSCGQSGRRGLCPELVQAGWLVGRPFDLRFSCSRKRFLRQVANSSKRFQNLPGRRCRCERGVQDRLLTRLSTWLLPVWAVCAFCKSVAVLWSPDVVRSGLVLRVKLVTSELESRNVSWNNFCTSVQSSFSKPHDRRGIPISSTRSNSSDHAKPPRFFSGRGK